MSQTTIDNKAERMALIQRFLNAETSVEEEKVLSGYFATHQPDDDEREVALLCNTIRNTFAFEEEYESDLSGEYEAIIQGRKSLKSKKLIVYFSGIAASILVLFAISFYLKSNQTAVVSKLSMIEKHTTGKAMALVSPDSVSQKAIENDSIFRTIKAKTPYKTKQNVSPKQVKKAIKERLSTPEMIGRVRYLADIALKKDKEIEMIPIGNAAVIVSADTATPYKFLAIPYDNDGNMQLFALEDE